MHGTSVKKKNLIAIFRISVLKWARKELTRGDMHFFFK